MKKHKFDTIIVVIVLVGFLIFFGLFFSLSNDKPYLAQVTEDNTLDEAELQVLESLSCEELKELVGTDKDVCMYVKDSNGDIKTISSCPGVC